MNTMKYNNNGKAGAIAYFISPHGYGHAARAGAVMAALQTVDNTIRFEIFTRVPRWFFSESLTRPFGYHELMTDIGLVQKNSLVEDLPETVNRLNQFLPFESSLINRLAEQIRTLRCSLIMCDIAPMGIAVAQQAGIPAVLVENFTWDWIYHGYTDHSSELAEHIEYFKTLSSTATYHIQTEPICNRRAASLSTAPVARKTRRSTAQTRQMLGVPEGAKIVVMSMGGMDWDYSFLENSAELDDLYIVVAGNNDMLPRRKTIINLQRDSGIFHPDLINACDAMIGKVGYSTIAEVYRAGVPFGYIARPAFRESSVLESYINRKMAGLPFTESDLSRGTWVSKLPDLLALPRIRREEPNGADQIAQFVHRLL